MNRKTSTLGLIFALGLLIGWTANQVHIPAVAAMPMGSMAVADRGMSSAMSRMNMKMQSMHMSGNADRDFMMMMIPHHRSAVDMARIELRYGKRPALKCQMQRWLRMWYGVR